MRAAAQTLQLAFVFVPLAIAGCTGGRATQNYAIETGDPEHGKQLIQGYGCGSCHVIPGIHDANGLVGPPLYFFSRRTMIAGELPNTPENLARWVQHPPQVEPGTAMPDLGLTPDQAKDVVAYLYTLR